MVFSFLDIPCFIQVVWTDLNFFEFAKHSYVNPMRGAISILTWKVNKQSSNKLSQGMLLMKSSLVAARKTKHPMLSSAIDLGYGRYIKDRNSPQLQPEYSHNTDRTWKGAASHGC